MQIARAVFNIYELYKLEEELKFESTQKLTRRQSKEVKMMVNEIKKCCCVDQIGDIENWITLKKGDLCMLVLNNFLKRRKSLFCKENENSIALAVSAS